MLGPHASSYAHITYTTDAHPCHIVDLSSKHGHLLNLLATPVTLCKGRQSASNIYIPRNSSKHGHRFTCGMVSASKQTRCLGLHAAPTCEIEVNLFKLYISATHRYHSMLIPALYVNTCALSMSLYISGVAIIMWLQRTRGKRTSIYLTGPSDASLAPSHMAQVLMYLEGLYACARSHPDVACTHARNIYRPCSSPIETIVINECKSEYRNPQTMIKLLISYRRTSLWLE